MVEIPKSTQTRLSRDIWIAGAAIAEYRKIDNIRDALEFFVRVKLDELIKEDEKFRDIWERINQEQQASKL